MLGIVIAVVVVLLTIAVPRLRRAALSVLGLLAIVTVGSSVFAGLIWALYESKPWLTATNHSAVAQEVAPSKASASGKGDKEIDGTAEADLAAALAEEEAERLEEEQQRLAEEKLHIALLAAKARVILEEDRKLAAQATAYPLPAGVGERLGDIMAIRIPAWRDEEVESAQKESIRNWLTSIGLKTEETASIVTAKAWGSLYDMWVAENPKASPPAPRPKAAQVATATPEPEASPHPAPAAQSETAVAPPPTRDRVPSSRQAARPPPPRRYSAPRPAPRPRRPPPRREREVGPFGY
jgi:hypothetical protein